VELAEATFVPNHQRETDIAILIVNASTCFCNVCGQEALPNEEKHTTVPIGGMIVINNVVEGIAGCGAKFIATTSAHEGVHGKNAARRLQPKLPFISAF